MHLLHSALRWALLTGLACAASAAALHAQTQIRVVGRVVPINGPTICNQRLSHQIECSRVYLVSSALDLNVWNGQVADLIGTDTGVTCRILNVTQAQAAAGTLDWSGSPTLGGTLTFTLQGPGISFNAAFLGTGSGYIPIDLTLGTLLVGLPIYVLGGGAGGGQLQFSVNVPVDPSLIGFTAYMQSVHNTIGPVGPPFFGNPICFTLR